MDALLADVAGHDGVEDVGERSVTNVVRKRRQPDDRPVRLIDDPLGEVRRHVHRPERMLEPRVAGSGIHEIGERELADTAKPLEGFCVDDRLSSAIELDELMDRIPNALG